MIQRFRQRFRDYWWMWVLIVVATVTLNEVFDRSVAGDKNGHPAGDVLVAIVVVVIVSATWDFATRKSRLRGETALSCGCEAHGVTSA